MRNKKLISFIKQRFQRISSDFNRSVLVLASGTALAQGIGLLALPLLTRLYNPSEFGLLAVFMALFTMLSGVTALRYEVAIPLPDKDEEAAHILGVALTCVFGMTLLVLLVILLAGENIANLVNSPNLTPYLLLLPIIVFFNGLYVIFQYWATRKKYFTQIARTKIDQSLAGIAVTLILGWLGAGVIGLLLWQFIRVSAGLLRLGKHAIKNSWDVLSKISISAMKKASLDYSQYPKYSTFDVLANSASIQIPILMIAAFTGNKEVAFLAMAMRIMQTPMALLGSSISQVYFSKAVEEHREGRLGTFTSEVLSKLTKIGIGPIIFAGIMAVAVIDTVLGPEWTRVGVLMMWMTPWFVLQFLSSPISMALHITGHQKTLLFLTLFGLVSRIVVLLLTIYFFDSAFASEAFILTTALFYAIFLFVCIHVSGVNLKSAMQMILSSCPIILIWVSAGLSAMWVYQTST